MNCWVVPLVMLGLVGVIATDMSVAGVTVRLVDPDMLTDVAVIVVEPAATEVADPVEPAALLMVATPVLDELQVTAVVRFCVVLSEKVPVAVNCWVVPLAMLGLVGVTAMDTSVALVTVIVVVLDMLPSSATMVVELTPAPVTSPILLIGTDVVSDELQVADAVRSSVVLSEYVPVAANC